MSFFYYSFIRTCQQEQEKVQDVAAPAKLQLQNVATLGHALKEAQQEAEEAEIHAPAVEEPEAEEVEQETNEDIPDLDLGHITHTYTPLSHQA